MGDIERFCVAVSNITDIRQTRAVDGYDSHQVAGLRLALQTLYAAPGTGQQPGLALAAATRGG